MLRFDWYRVILDEAHNIKNRNASRTKACLALRSELRWVVTGTPLQVRVPRDRSVKLFNINVSRYQNTVDDLYPLFAFLRIRFVCTWEDFNINVRQPINSGQISGMSFLQVSV